MQKTRTVERAAGHEQRRVSRRRWAAWLALLATAALVLTAYLAWGLAVSHNPVLLPLDDTYIHFQYARQWAHGHPMVYKPGEPPTSGATSLLYAPLLAVGYVLGFSGWRLAYWALGIGALSFFGSAWLVYLLGLRVPWNVPEHRRHGYALTGTLAFVLSGPFVWAALSGMETMPFVFTVLLTFYALARRDVRFFALSASLMVLTRPEGAILAGLGALALATWLWLGTETRGAHVARRPATLRRAATSRAPRLGRWAWLAVPLMLSGVQPLLNWALTGDATSSGMRAKSHLYNTSAPLTDRLHMSGEFFVRMWRELLSGISTDYGFFMPWILSALALGTVIVGTIWAVRRRQITLPVMMLVWLLALTAGVATLDTAFWQFKRYQLPAIALFYPAAAWGAAMVSERLRRYGRVWPWALPVLIVLGAALTTPIFAYNYAANVGIVRGQQYPMERWVRAHVPPDARIVVHDVGLMGYFTPNPLYDVVGLTTPGSAASWREGPGATFEHLAHSASRPSWFAIYPDVQGLRYLVNAGVFGQEHVSFPLKLPHYNVATSGGYQSVYEADWTYIRERELVAQPTTLRTLDGFELVDTLDVANLESEAAHDYRWWEHATPPGFATEIFRYRYYACGLDEDGCWAVDGGRVLTGGEEFTLHTDPGRDLLLITRVHAHASVPLRVIINGELAATRVQPEIPGHWVEIATLVDGTRITGTETRVRIEAEIADADTQAYMPYTHWAYQGTFVPEQEGAEPVARFGPEGQMRLLAASLDYTPPHPDTDGQLSVTLRWEGPAPQTGDGVIFIHLYNESQIDVGPALQQVARAGGGVYPPANWLPETFEDVYTLPLPASLPPGKYVVALGVFEARSGARYPVQSKTWETTNDMRLFIGTIIVEE